MTQLGHHENPLAAAVLRHIGTGLAAVANGALPFAPVGNRASMIADLIFAWARRTPEKTAVIYNEQPWSYRAFAEQIATARGYFLRRGYAGPGYAVLAVRNRMDFWILSLALRNLGLTTVVIGNAAMLRELELPDVRCVITRPGEAWLELDSVCKARGLTPLSVSLEQEPSPDRALPEAQDEPGGHILFTSGTTGRHKMVLSTPAIDAAVLRSMVEVNGMEQNTVLSVFHFPAWTGVGYKWAASPWMVGGTTLIEQRHELHRALLHPGLTHAVLNPKYLDRVLAAPRSAFARKKAIQLVVAGGAMTRHQVEEAKARITPRVFNALASTEASIIAYTALETREDLRWHRLLPDRVIEVVSESGRHVSPGELGRVRVSTEDGPKAYLNDEHATKEHFRDGYFYSGDLAITRSDGRIALQGRSTDVLNVQGHKIFPGPIEEHLCEGLGVSGVCLVSMQNEHGEEELYVAIETPKPIDAEQLRVALGGALEKFPRVHVRFLRSLPRNPMGKVLRQAVRAQVAASLDTLN